MKKMMIVACTIALAGMVQAASVGWSLMGCKNYAGDAYSVFVIGQNGVESVAQVTALCAAGKDVSSYAFGSGNIGSTGLGTVAAASSGKTIAQDGTTTYEGFFVIFDAADATMAGNYVAITSEQSSTLLQKPSASSAAFTFAAGNQSTFVNETKNWTAVGGVTPPGPTPDVPEPTSALLLAIGGAMLALRRKQK